MPGCNITASRLSQRGRAAIVLANGSMTTQTSGEGEIRKNLINSDLVEVYGGATRSALQQHPDSRLLVVPVQGQGAGVNGSIDRKGEVLFIDCRKKGAEQPAKPKLPSPTTNCTPSR